MYTYCQQFLSDARFYWDYLGPTFDAKTCYSLAVDKKTFNQMRFTNNFNLMKPRAKPKIGSGGIRIHAPAETGA